MESANLLILQLELLAKQMEIAMYYNIAINEQRNAFLNKPLANFAIQKLSVPMALYAILILQPDFKDAPLIFLCLTELKFQEKIYFMTISLANQDTLNSSQTHFIA